MTKAPLSRYDSICSPSSHEVYDVYEEASLDELTRTSLCGSVDELVSLHQSRVDAQKEAKELARLAEQESLESERRAGLVNEITLMYKSMKSRRQEALARREAEARKDGAQLGRAIAATLSRTAQNSLESEAKLQAEQREGAYLRGAKQKRHLQGLLRAALLLGTFGLIVGTSLFSDVGARNNKEAQQLQEQASLQESDAKARVMFLENELKVSVRLVEGEKASLRGELQLAREELVAAQERLQAEQEEASGMARLAKKKSVSASSQAHPKASPVLATPAEPRSSGPFLTGTCMAGDPLCGTL